jgi:hypothetical protein
MRSNADLGIFKIPRKIEKVINEIVRTGTADVSGEEFEVKTIIGQTAKRTGAWTYQSPLVFGKKRVRVIGKTPKHVIIKTEDKE